MAATTTGRCVRCWWCSKYVAVSQSITPPTHMAPGRACTRYIGYFCSVACAKAYIIQHGMPVYPLKQFLWQTRGIPLSTPLPTAPPWQALVEFDPVHGVPRTMYHNTHAGDWACVNQSLLELSPVTVQPQQSPSDKTPELLVLPTPQRQAHRHRSRDRSVKCVVRSTNNAAKFGELDERLCREKNRKPGTIYDYMQKNSSKTQRRKRQQRVGK